ncbi:zinc finger FYVE domain-containing protein 9-like isoform X1 [Myxocyprinus asiaticus]|uniref:zinc finger FYVE domain-containing protein 9-like isoform X1 n=1 Tax=Myxocyprinus asiaticus TaxID=70543 RepID=UPI00222294BE|nr:zinc finger FYVE domain-containing protein 9-like isoform X1 [Myxocyprinus asiaticus]XP_051555343.1 zinc finger FYVE domain-containing protein 9-like isoform X1 [Myxocyprinus asiaticus]XP_051555344.1 zinc finger FYVE domain-containing protein 9-like isoform X1 [Myxocyprinus asiaticus]XP_051555345.1 zinc finger FYVE domain-containing protein 9-like isoform X1 [Myxocyprinus asiaticus]
MENYFQAEAFNLDKVLDEFEQNEDDTDTPTLSDAKWTQILAPSSHLLSLNTGLTHSDLSPRDSPISFKPLLESHTLDGSSLAEVTRLEGKRGQGEQPEGRSEDRPADVYSPPLPQPNIGKLVSTEGQFPDLPSSNRVGLENHCSASPNHSGCSEDLQANNEKSQPITDQQSVLDTGPCELRTEKNDTNEGSGTGLNDSHFPFPKEGLGSRPSVLKNGVSSVEMEASKSDSEGSPVGDQDVGMGDCNLTFQEGSIPQKRETVLHKMASGSVDCVRENHEGAFQNGGLVETESEGKFTWTSHQEKKDKMLEKDQVGMHSDSVAESPGVEKSLFNGLIVDLDRNADSQPLVPSKEDSVTEEKEMEESKQDCCDPVRGSEAGRMCKLNNNRLQPVSVPYGGARPKQPVSLKLQIPQPLSSQVQNEFCSSGKNKNLEPQCRTGDLELSCGGTESGEVRINGETGDGSSALLISSESPDNDLQADQQGAFSKKPYSSLGEVAPVWVPDSQAPICMKCEVKFTFTKRRHHCRACGEVFCAACCSLKSRLMYMDRKEARVCVTCHRALINAQALENMGGGCNQSPNPNNPAEYCSTIPPLQQAQASGAFSSPPPTVMVPVGVLKQTGTDGSLTREQRRVWFADGILPNGEATDSAEGPAANPKPPQPVAASQYSSKSSAANASDVAHAPVAPTASPVGSSLSLIPEDGLPPILISTGIKGGTGGHITDYAVEERPSEIVLMQQLEEGGPDPLVFVLNANLLAMVKLVNYVNRKCWYMTTKGMHAVGQVEVVVLLQCLPDEKTIPKDIFSHFVQLYREALTGNVLRHLGHSFFTQSFLGSKEHGGFLYISPTFQSLQDLPLPNPPYVFGILVQKWETPWAKVFPIRLMLRLGAEYRFYPCPLFSVRFRKPLFGETGHTIMNLLADFRNYQYTLPVVEGLVLDMEVRKTCIKIPSNRYNELMKAMNKSNEHVLAMGACFNERADSHLVCVQNDDGNYQTQAISIHHQPRKVTGASFFVFSGALKASSGFLAKTSIVEDGVMVQITAETMEALRQALREMKDFSIACGKAYQEENKEQVQIQWIEDDHNVNKGVISPIDGKSMESVTSVKIFHGSEYKANGKVIRWTEVFFLRSEDQTNGLSDLADHSRLTENMARAFCMALCPHLKLLKEDGMAKLGLRVTLNSDQVGYLAGSNGHPLLPQYLSDLDSALIPVIHSGACQLSEGPVVMELIFYILEIIS